jgi:hypothetical protein
MVDFLGLERKKRVGSKVKKTTRMLQSATLLGKKRALP